MNSTPMWMSGDMHANVNSSLTNSMQLPTFKVNMDTESVRSGYSDRSKRSRGNSSHSVSHSTSNNVLIGNHVNSNSNHHHNHNHRNSHNTHSGHHRSSSRHSHRSTRSDRAFMISKLESPDERHEAQEVIEVQILPQDDNWGDNTTAVTGNTSDHSVSIDDMNKIGKDLWSEQSVTLRCQMWTGTVLTAILCLCAFVSPIIMVALPRVELFEWKVKLDECGPECDGLLISFAFKLLILLFGSWAVFMRRPRATMPRIFIYRAVVMALVFIFLVSYWLFYMVRIVERLRLSESEMSYHNIVSFAVSLVDALLFIHYLAVILIEIRHIQPQYFVKVVRSPDGSSHCYNIGQLSIQRAAVWILERYYRDFAIYNPYLETVPTKKCRKSSFSSNHVNATTTAALKYYDVDGMTTTSNNTTALSGSTSMGIGIGISGHTNINSNTHRSFLNGSASNNEFRNRRERDRESSSHHHHHNERFYEEHEYERRVRKRKARLITATEEAFTHIKRIHDERGGPAIPMDPKDAAQAIFPSMARALQKFLRITRQQPRHTMQSIVDHLALCLSFDMSPKAFLEKYMVSVPVLQNDCEHKPIQSWSLVCDILLSRSIEVGTVFMLRQGDVSLLVSVHQLPHFNISEEVIDPKSNKFVFRLNSETSV